MSSVSGRVTLAELLDEADLERLNDDVDPTRRLFYIQPETDSIDLDSDCCVYCCRVPVICDCGCCECEWDCER